MTHNLIRAVKVFENYLNTDHSPFNKLKPRLRVGGSIIEATRLGSPDELDLSLQFNELRGEYFVISNSALKLKIVGRGRELMKDWMTDDFCLDMYTILKDLLKTLQDCLRKSSHCLPANVDPVSGQTQWSPCLRCQEKNTESGKPWVHCESCIPSIAMSKAGAVVILQHTRSIVSIDVIPLFPTTEGDTVKLHKLVRNTLAKEQPLGWRRYLDRFNKVDHILPEAMDAVQPIENPLICLKILNFGAGVHNFILRPGHILAVNELNEPFLKDVYCMMKALKAHFAASLKSYSLKNVILSKEYVDLSEEDTSSRIDVLFEALQHPLLKVEFEKYIDYDAWEQKIQDAMSAGDDSHYLVPLKTSSADTSEDQSEEIP